MNADLDGEGRRAGGGGSGVSNDPQPYLWPERIETVPLDPTPEGAMDSSPSDPLIIEDGAGRVILRFTEKGVVEMPDPDRMPEAAAIFFREVINTAELLGYPVRRLPWEKS